MKKILTRSQKTASAIVALMLGFIITISAVMNSFGITNDEETAINIAESKMLQRAYDDIKEDDIVEIEIDDQQLIKVYDSEDNLIEIIRLKDGSMISNINDQKLVQEAEFLTSYGNVSIYKILK